MEIRWEKPQPPAAQGGAAPAVAHSPDLYRALFDRGVDPILLTRPDGTVLRANAAACRAFGLSEAELCRQGRAGRVVDDEALRAFLAARERTGSATGVLHVRHADGRVLTVEASSSILLQEGAERYTYLIFKDLTAARRAEEELRDSREKLAAIHDAAPFAIALSRLPDHTVVSVNDAFLALLEYDREEVVGNPALELGILDEACRARVLGEVERRGTARELECACVTKTGKRRVLLVNAQVLQLGGGAYLLTTAQDITSRKRAEEALRESELKLRLLADAMPQIVCVLAPDGTALYVNRSWQAYSGLDLRATRRAGWLQVLHPDDFPAALACRRRALKSLAPQDVELRYRAAGGSYRWFLCRLAPVAEGDRVVRLVGAAMDIEDRKRAEEALRGANERLRDADRHKDEFLGMLSHELRSPLAPIRQSVFLLRHAGGERSAVSLAVIERQVEHLTRLVDDLLDVTRIARGKVQLRKVRLDLADLARRTGDDFRVRIEARGVGYRVVTPDAPVWVEGDETRLAQIVSNLLHNASKFTRPGDEVTLTVDGSGGQARLQVRDTGAGIDPAMLANVFDPFVQADRTRARTEGGLGLGLALVKGLVSLHGGAVQAESAGRGKGAAFTVELPLAQEPGEERPRRARGAERAAGRRVLVVDDNRDAADTLMQLAALLGHDAEVAYDASSALEKLRARLPDVVLCDLGLPGMDGYEFARRVRASVRERIRLVAVSGYAQPDDVDRALQAGFDAHVAKPADPERIAELLQ